jgi:DNA mismatch repair protein MutS
VIAEGSASCHIAVTEDRPSEALSAPESEETERQMSLFDFAPDPVISRLREVDLMNTTPSQALALLEELKEYL